MNKDRNGDRSLFFAATASSFLFFLIVFVLVPNTNRSSSLLFLELCLFDLFSNCCEQFLSKYDWLR
jgi:hypothetical protein